MMTTTQTLLVAGAVGAMMLTSAPAAYAQAAPRPQRLNINSVYGDVRIQQGLPCKNRLDLTTSIQQGRMELTWLQVQRDAVLIDLMRLNLFVKPFHVDASCSGIKAAVDFREIGISLASALRFTATPTGAGGGLVQFTIPKEKFLIFESVLNTAPVKQPETEYRLPAEDVTGVIDLRNQTVQLRVLLNSELHFRAGCEKGRCRIDETLPGTIASDVRGRYVPPRR
jgi:hypothetical protein